MKNTSFEKSRNKKVTRVVKYFNFEILTDKVAKEWGNNIKILIFVRRIISKKILKLKNLKQQLMNLIIFLQKK
jgi:hypothetical protein